MYLQLIRFCFFLSFLALLAGCTDNQKCEKEIYLLPDGFRGHVILFFDQKDGAKISYEGDSRLYVIPRSGFLKSQFKKNGGCMSDGRVRFYTVDSVGNRTPMTYFLGLKPSEIPRDKDYVIFSLLSDKRGKPDFVIHIVGRATEFRESMERIRYLDPVTILESLP
jgi:hypothetical protein